MNTHAGEEPRDQSPRTVLIVDDDEFIRIAAEMLLQRAGYHVLVAANADTAETIAKSQPIDLALLDVMMPGRDGPALARSLSNISPATKIIFMSGYPARVLTARGYDLLPAPLLVKPVRPAELLEQVKKQLEAQ